MLYTETGAQAPHINCSESIGKKRQVTGCKKGVNLDLLVLIGQLVMMIAAVDTTAVGYGILRWYMSENYVDFLVYFYTLFKL